MNLLNYNTKMLSLNLKLELSNLKKIYIKYNYLNELILYNDIINNKMLILYEKKNIIKFLNKNTIKYLKIRNEIIILIDEIINSLKIYTKNYLESNNISYTKLLNINYKNKYKNFLKNYNFLEKNTEYPNKKIKI